MTTERKRGIVKFFNKTKGFGFIINEESGKDIFVHNTGIVNKLEGLNIDQLVEYSETDGKKGMIAVDVRRLG